MVMNTPHPGSKQTRSSSITIDAGERLSLFPSEQATACAFKPSVTALNCKEHTDSTSGTRRLNSSKHPQAPEDARPAVKGDVRGGEREEGGVFGCYIIKTHLRTDIYLLVHIVL